MTALDDLHREMGRFLTESSHLENLMLLYVAVTTQRSFPDVIVDFMGKPFGDKIKDFKKVHKAHAFSEEHQKILEDVYSKLDLLLPKRNFIVHGSTHELFTKDKAKQWYRIGMARGNADYFVQAFKENLTGPHVFTTAGIVAVTDECIALRKKLDDVTTEMLAGLNTKVAEMLQQPRS